MAEAFSWMTGDKGRRWDIRPSNHHKHSRGHWASPNVAREAEHQQDGLPRNFAWGSWQEKHECQTSSAQSNSRARGGSFWNLCRPFGNYKQERPSIIARDEHGAYSTIRKPRRNLTPSTGKETDCVFWLQRCKAREICSTGSNCTPRCLQRLLQSLRDSIRRRRPELWSKKKKWFLPHNDAQPHAVLHLKQFLSVHQMRLVIQICQLGIFSPSWLKPAVQGRRSADIQVIQTAAIKHLCSLPESAFQNCFKNFQKAWKRFTDAGGSYFEDDL